MPRLPLLVALLACGCKPSAPVVAEPARDAAIAPAALRQPGRYVVALYHGKPVAEHTLAAVQRHLGLTKIALVDGKDALVASQTAALFVAESTPEAAPPPRAEDLAYFGHGLSA